MDPRPRGLEHLSTFQLKDELSRYDRDQTQSKSATHTFLNAGQAPTPVLLRNFRVRVSAGEQKVTPDLVAFCENARKLRFRAPVNARWPTISTQPF